MHELMWSLNILLNVLDNLLNSEQSTQSDVSNRLKKLCMWAIYSEFPCVKYRCWFSVVQAF